MPKTAKCSGCNYTFTFDTERVAKIRRLLESEGAKQPPPEAYIVECPKCRMRLQISAK